MLELEPGFNLNDPDVRRANMRLTRRRTFARLGRLGGPVRSEPVATTGSVDTGIVTLFRGTPTGITRGCD